MCVCVSGGCLADGKPCFSAGMASSETPSLPLKHGVRVVAQPNITVEHVWLAVSERVGHGNILCASRMNKAVVGAGVCPSAHREWPKSEQ